MAEMEELNMEVAPEALEAQKKFYGERYAAGYMESFEYYVYERCRLYTVQKVLATLPVPKKILDYGCGQGRYIAELRKIFTVADISGCDVSDQGLEIARTSNPGVSFLGMDNESIDCLDESFDLVISIEVLEHVGDVQKAFQKFVGGFRPGARHLYTPPAP